MGMIKDLLIPLIAAVIFTVVSSIGFIVFVNYMERIYKGG